MTHNYRESIDLDGRLHQLFLDVDAMSSDLAGQIRHIAIDVLDAPACSPEQKELIAKQSELLNVYVALNDTLMKLHEYYVPHLKDSD